MSVIGVAVAAYGVYSGNKSASAARRAGAQQSAAAIEFQKEQAALVEKQKEVYRDMEFKTRTQVSQTPMLIWKMYGKM